MAGRVYLIGIRWVDTPMNTAMIERVIDSHGNWLRYNGFTWLFWTKLTALELYEILRHHLKTGDTTLIIRVDPSDYMGWAPPFVWDWLKDKAACIQRGE